MQYQFTIGDRKIGIVARTYIHIGAGIKLSQASKQSTLKYQNQSINQFSIAINQIEGGKRRKKKRKKLGVNLPRIVIHSFLQRKIDSMKRQEGGKKKKGQKGGGGGNRYRYNLIFITCTLSLSATFLSLSLQIIAIQLFTRNSNHASSLPEVKGVVGM